MTEFSVKLTTYVVGCHTDLCTSFFFDKEKYPPPLGACGVCMCTCVGQRSTCRWSSSVILSYSLRQTLSLDPELTMWTRLSGQGVPRTCLFVIDTYYHTQPFYMGVGSLNSGLHACAASTSLTEPSPQPPKSHFKTSNFNKRRLHEGFHFIADVTRMCLRPPGASQPSPS